MFDHDNVIQKKTDYSHLMLSSNKIENDIAFQIDFDNFILRNLDIREMVVLQMMLSGYNQREIANHNRVARETINRLIKNIKIKFTSFFKG